MLNEFSFTFYATAFLTLRDNKLYMSYDEFVSHLRNDKKVQANYRRFVGDDNPTNYTFKDFIDDDAFSDYLFENNYKLADELNVDLDCNWYKSGPEYRLKGTWTALHTFCEQACGPDGEVGEALYKYKQAIDKLKASILKL